MGRPRALPESAPRSLRRSVAEAGKSWPALPLRLHAQGNRRLRAAWYRWPGISRHLQRWAGLGAGKAARAWRIRVRDQITAFEDVIQGRITQNLAKDIGDFILKRADGCYAYQL